MIHPVHPVHPIVIHHGEEYLSSDNRYKLLFILMCVLCMLVCFFSYELTLQVHQT